MNVSIKKLMILSLAGLSAACSNQGFTVSNQAAVATATHVLESPLTPTAPRQNRNRVNVVNPDTQSELRVSMNDIDVHFENLFVRGNFGASDKPLAIKFDLIRNGQTIAYEMAGNFNVDGEAVLEVRSPNQSQARFFRASGRCMDQCGWVVIDLVFISETKEFWTQYRSELHPDFRAAQLNVIRNGEANESAQSSVDQGADQRASQNPSEGAAYREGDIPSLPGQVVRPYIRELTPGRLRSDLVPLVRDRDLQVIPFENPQTGETIISEAEQTRLDREQSARVAAEDSARTQALEEARIARAEDLRKASEASAEAEARQRAAHAELELERARLRAANEAIARARAAQIMADQNRLREVAEAAQRLAELRRQTREAAAAAQRSQEATNRLSQQRAALEAAQRREAESREQAANQAQREARAAAVREEQQKQEAAERAAQAAAREAAEKSALEAATRAAEEQRRAAEAQRVRAAEQLAAEERSRQASQTIALANEERARARQAEAQRAAEERARAEQTLRERNRLAQIEEERLLRESLPLPPPEPPPVPAPPVVPAPSPGGITSPMQMASQFLRRVWSEGCSDFASEFQFFPCPILGPEYAGQATGYYGNYRRRTGALINGTALSRTNPHFTFWTREGNFGTGLKVLFLEAVGAEIFQRLNHRIVIGDISHRQGGPIGHMSHQNGLDSDLYTIKNRAERFDVDKNWVFLKTLFKYNVVHRVYTSTENKQALCRFAKNTREYDAYKHILSSLRVVIGHHDHFHVRLKCTRHNRQSCLHDQSATYATECN